ncbi:MAG: GNAT family N-acetyltransferase [Pseudomonadota bacterium]
MIPTLTTERLVLRAPKLSDFDRYAEFRASERARFVGGPNNRAQAWQQFAALAGQWMVRGYGRWIVAHGATDAPLGVVGLHHPEDWPGAELAWSLFAAGEGQGFAEEAAIAAREFAYGSLHWPGVFSLVDPANARSLSLATRLGCQPDGVFQHPVFGDMHIWRHPTARELRTT